MVHLRDIIDFRAFADEHAMLADLRKAGVETGSAVGQTVKSLLIFETTKQRSWLFITAAELVCIIDDRRQPAPSVRWSLPLKPGHNFNFVVGPHSEQSGSLEIDGKTILYSKRFFGDMPPDERILQGIKRVSIYEPETEHAA